MNLAGQSFVVSALVLNIVSSAAGTTGKSPGVVGAYVAFRSAHAGTPEQVRILVNEAADAGIQFLVPAAKSTGGMAFYNSKIMPAVYRDFDPLKVLIETARKRGLKVYPWVCANVDGGRNFSALLEAHPDWSMVSSKGERVGWLDPSSPEVRAHIASIIREIAESYEIDGVSLDYVRYPGRFCYCSRCAEAFEQAFGLDCREADRARPGTNLWRKWRLWRQRQLTAEVEEIRHALECARPGASLSSYVWGVHTYGSAYRTCQDWKTWIKQGLLDWINPSGYVYSRDEFRKRVRDNVAAVPPAFPLLVTIGVKTSHGELETPDEVEVYIRDSLALGADGIVLFTLEWTRRFLGDLTPVLRSIAHGDASSSRRE